MSEDISHIFGKIILVCKKSLLNFEHIYILPSEENEVYLDSFKNMWSVDIITQEFGTFNDVDNLKNLYQADRSQSKVNINDVMDVQIDDIYLPNFQWQLKQKGVKPLRDILYQKQNGICPVCSRQIKDPVLDHMHTKKIQGTGQIRGTICNLCNTYIARIENNARRHHIKVEELPEILNNIANYFQDQKLILHPSEAPKQKRVQKRDWNRIKKYYFKLYPNRRTLPSQPKYQTENYLKLLDDINKIKDGRD